MSWIPTRKKDNEYEELLPRRTNCSSRNIRELREQKKCEGRQHHELHKTRNTNYGSQSEVAWFAIACTWLSALIPSSYAQRELRALRPVSTFTTSLEKLSRRTADQHHEELSDVYRRDAREVHHPSLVRPIGTILGRLYGCPWTTPCLWLWVMED